MEETDGPYECAECGADDHPSSECPNRSPASRCPESGDGRHRVGFAGFAEYYDEETYVGVECGLCHLRGSLQIDPDKVRW